MRLIDADMGREKLWEIYNAWNLAMAPAERREIAYIDKKMRLCELMIKFLDQLPTVAPPPNPPLTLEELREMDGEPVWVRQLDGTGDGWALVNASLEMISAPGFFTALFENCGKAWLAYRRRPEEVVA